MRLWVGGRDVRLSGGGGEGCEDMGGGRWM